ncbi:phosphatidate phosphatase App1 family protein [Aliikangiella sp. IMCC44359]|uniref:phosphatidate phosphatase App1 family protein n=1 Tax=Aliikangiella sp. IMCC44359 TaxID=3459125 RepID=UPI00403AFCC7
MLSLRYLLFPILMVFTHLSYAKNSAEEAEKRVVVYNSYGYLVDNIWHIPLHVWVSEAPNWLSGIAGKGALKLIKNKIGIDELTPIQEARFQYVAEDFLADNESREVISFQFDKDSKQHTFTISNNNKPLKSDRNGNIKTIFKLTKADANRLLKAQSSKNGWLTIKINSENHQGTGKIRLIPEEGVSVISDIDDTVKVTNILQGSQEILNNTFFKPFKPVNKMSNMYKDFSSDVAFHYISGSPWQLYKPITDFLFVPEVNFPQGSLHMKNVRVNLLESESYSDIAKLLTDGSQITTFKQKISQISQILYDFPKRKFILVGDSGELDPEVYRKIKNNFKEQIIEIKIRDVKNDNACNQLRLKDMTIIKVEHSKLDVCLNNKLK